MDNGASSYRRYMDGEEAAFEQIVKDYFDLLVRFIDSYVSIWKMDLSALNMVRVN